MIQEDLSKKRLAPDLAVYDFEGQMESALSQAVINSGMVEPVKQGDDRVVQTPRIEGKFVCGAQHQKSYIPPNTSANYGYQNLYEGRFLVKVVTSRKKPDQRHAEFRSKVRWIFQDFDNTLSPNMKYLNIVQALQASCANSFDQNNQDNITVIEFSIWFNIRPSAFPTNPTLT